MYITIDHIPRTNYDERQMKKHEEKNYLGYLRLSLKKYNNDINELEWLFFTIKIVDIL